MKTIDLFYATENKSKLHNMVYRLREYPIRVLCPTDLGIHLDIEESGATAVENALLKANAYYQAVKIPTIAADSGVRIEGIPEEAQPGLYVRRVNGKVLTDEEMIDHYAALAQNAQQKCWLQYLTGVAMINGTETVTMVLPDPPLRLVPVPNTDRRHRGNPLDVVTQTEDGIYYNTLTDQERTARDQFGEQKFTEFILSHLLKGITL